MAIMKKIEYAEAPPTVRAVYDDIMTSRNTDYINNIWKVLANDPVSLKRNWEAMKEIMAPGALDKITKELIYLAVSITNQCDYCINTHTAAARKAGMSDAMFAELVAVVGVANQGNKTVKAYQVEIDERYLPNK
jgi:AhpD family alkylhydroperoxidase